MQPSILLAGAIVTVVTIYALLGGADYGAGMLEFTASGKTREAQLSLIDDTITPVWETNHIWLIFAIVLLFSGFPKVFAAIMSALFIPIFLCLAGILFRGAAFVFRAYFTQSRSMQLLFARIFSIASLLTPICLGIVIGAVAQGSVTSIMTASNYNGATLQWLTPFTVVTGLFTASIFAYLAAVYLTQESSNPQLQEAFRNRALIAGASVGFFAALTFLLSIHGAPDVFHGLTHNWWARYEQIFTAIASICAFTALWKRRYRLAQVCVILQTALIIWGWALSQYPGMAGPGQMTIQQSAAPDNILWTILAVAVCGLFLLVPSMIFLFRIFRSSSPKSVSTISHAL
ncbi:cytochrome d ubiquinol oxidase subunit II [Terriglobus tenax]|uniref:cytochrome d ubiquinol oxidase subunit II n=1 Tax=Terriglobus tenax TaxID=1111115 RepID=UPI0021DF9D65|nr:cytochrome d ubiquinol oxidase subunit II [Terriglobus tenax]